MRTKRKLLIALLVAVTFSGSFLYFVSKKEEVSVLYVTDLSKDSDFDDYFDLAMMYSLKNINLSIVLDNNQGIQETNRSGANAIEDLNRITGKKYSYAIGLNTPLLKDGKMSSKSNQVGIKTVDNIIQMLEDSPEKSVVITVGSLRDIAAAYIKNPNVMKEKVSKLVIFAGDYNGSYMEHNAALDSTAYTTIMNSELPIYWIPCFENGLFTMGDHSSYFTMQHKEVFTKMDDIYDWFLYNFEKSDVDFSQYNFSGGGATYLWKKPVTYGVLLSYQL